MDDDEGSIIGTFDYQDKIPKLPLPDLKSTLLKFLDTVHSITSISEFQDAESKVFEFLSNSGPKIYQKLQEYNSKVDNYVDEFWFKAYVGYKDPVVVNVNPIFLFEDDPNLVSAGKNCQILRAAGLMLSSLKFISSLKHETLLPDIWRQEPLCMSQFKRLFATCRIPRETLDDEVVTYDDSKHFVVICKGQFYYFEGLNDNFEVVLTEREICKNLEAILKDADSEDAALARNDFVGLLTAEDRNVWAGLRNKLVQSSLRNKKVLEIIDSALFIICLDESCPNTPTESAKVLLHSTTYDRWFDKLQLIITKNGHAGINFEHSVVDGHTVLRFASDVFTDNIIKFAQTISGASRVNNFIDVERECVKADTNGHANPIVKSFERLNLPQRRNKEKCGVRRIRFELSAEIKKQIKFADSRLGDIISRLDLQVVEFTGYGKTFITQNGMSPDAFVQIAILSSYYITYGKVVNQYESVLTKSYKLGRTEAARTASIPAKEFIECFYDLFYLNSKGATDSFATKPRKTKEEKEELQTLHEKLLEALKAHGRNIREASKGLGVDRLLFALKNLYQLQKTEFDFDMPEIFDTVAYKRLCENILSTSNCGNPSLRLFGFGPVCENGFGIGYIIKDDSMNFCITSKCRQTKKLAANLVDYLGKVQDLLLELEPLDYENLIRLHRNQSQRGYNFFGLDDDSSMKNNDNYFGTLIS